MSAISSAADRLLIASIHEGATQMARHALASGADCDARDERGESALHLCARLGRLGIIDALLKAGADNSMLDRSGMTASQVAQQRGERLAARRLGAC